MDAIANRDTDAFVKIQNDARALFPSVAKVGLINVSASQKEVAVTLADGNRIGAKAMSEGLLYYLAFLALRYVEGSHLFLVEEPENGLHPARIAEVMGVLREMSKTSQVIIATHSPLVVNELGGDEVSVVTRTVDDGTRAILLKDVPGYADAMKVYRPGEFWVSYCNGEDEGPLLSGTPRQ
jgi:predicted ATPase